MAKQMVSKPTLLYTAGSYGGLLSRIINNAPPLIAETYHSKNLDLQYTLPTRNDHHLVSENDIEGRVIKITYDNNDISLINRNKWHKVKDHLLEQSNRSYPNNPNKEIYTMAIHVCDLLGATLFKSIEKKETIEFKFKFFTQDLSAWKYQFGKIHNTLRIPFNNLTIAEHYDCFQKGQEIILNKHRDDNDDIAKSYKLGKKYYSVHHNHYNEDYFNQLIWIGGNNGW